MAPASGEHTLSVSHPVQHPQGLAWLTTCSNGILGISVPRSGASAPENHALLKVEVREQTTWAEVFVMIIM